jgi:hypothetical protein
MFAVTQNQALAAVLMGVSINEERVAGGWFLTSKAAVPSMSRV